MRTTRTTLIRAALSVGAVLTPMACSGTDDTSSTATEAAAPVSTTAPSSTTVTTSTTSTTGAPAPGRDDLTSDEPTGDELTMGYYYSWVAETLSFAIGEISAGPPPGGAVPEFESARQALEVRAGFYDQLRSTFEGVDPPAAAREAHQAYIDAAALNASVLRAAAERAPADASPEEVEQYEYANADTGYAFVAETNAKCALNRVFDSSGFAPYEFQRWCDPAPRAGTALGTEDAPVNEVAFIHEPSDRPSHPNMWFDVTEITASASAPITFTLENRNPEPYLFNIAIYEGTPESLEGLEPIAQTVAATGAFTQTLEVDLEPGAYTYADNVHAYSMRGTLTVV
jgi:hypothetical protein